MWCVFKQLKNINISATLIDNEKNEKCVFLFLNKALIYIRTNTLCTHEILNFFKHSRLHHDIKFSWNSNSIINYIEVMNFFIRIYNRIYS